MKNLTEMLEAVVIVEDMIDQHLFDIYSEAVIISLLNNLSTHYGLSFRHLKKCDNCPNIFNKNYINTCEICNDYICLDCYRHWWNKCLSCPKCYNTADRYDVKIEWLKSSIG